MAKWSHLEVVDRANGEVERIHLDSPNAGAEIASGASSAQMTVAAAWKILEDGGQLLTSGYVRRLAK